MICDNFRMHWAGVFLRLMFLRMIVVVGRGIAVNRPYLWAGANRERYRAGKNKNLFLHVGSYVFCSGGRVGCGGLGKCRRHACRYSGRLRPRKLSGLVTLAVAEREREGSAAKSAQRMSVRPAALYRETGAPASAANKHW